ncbi:MAG: hypothetical protein ACYCZQ_13005 [Burkholderiales bacterium]
MSRLTQSTPLVLGTIFSGLGVLLAFVFTFIHWKLTPDFNELRLIEGIVQTAPIVARHVKGFPWIEFSMLSRHEITVLRIPNITFLQSATVEEIKRLKPGDPISAWTIDYSSAIDDKNITWQLHSGGKVVVSFSDRVTAEHAMYLRDVKLAISFFVGTGAVFLFAALLRNHRQRKSSV